MKANPLSTNQKVKREVRKIMRGKGEMPLYPLRLELAKRLEVRLREDYLVCNLLGMKDLGIDCESRTVLNLRER